MGKLTLAQTAVVITVMLMAVWGGCGGSTAITRFYLLDSMAEPAGEVGAGAAGHKDIVIGVGPVNIPEYLKRSEIVTRDGRNKLLLADFDLWAEPLEENVSRVLAKNLSILLPSNRIAVFPWRGMPSIQYQIKLDLIRFDGEQNGHAFLDARWMILSGKEKEILLVRRSAFREPIVSKTYEAIVGAQSRLIEKLSRDIAAALGSLHDKTSF